MSFYDAAVEIAAKRWTETQGGKAIQSASANGQSVIFTLPSPNGSGMSPQDSAELMEEILSRFDAAKEALISAGTPEPTESAILTELLAMLQPCHEVMPDFSQLLTQ